VKEKDQIFQSSSTILSESYGLIHTYILKKVKKFTRII